MIVAAGSPAAGTATHSDSAFSFFALRDRSRLRVEFW